MKINNTFVSLALLLCLHGLANAAGGPLNEDLTYLAVPAGKAVEAGKRGDSETFIKEADDAMTKAKSATMSAGIQRIISQLRSGINKAKAGKLDEAVSAVEEAMMDMKKSGPPKFGGGS